jgi:hypothetical protein
MGPPHRRAILVLGMHRSGTSTVARVANLLGAALPTDLYPPDALNPTGYWESQHLVGLNEWVLQSAGATWSDCLRFDPAQVTGPGLVGVMASLVGCTKTLFGDERLFVMKDPRLCLLLDFWLPALRSLGIEVTVLYVLRSPLAVARSLLYRNGFALPQGLALWLRYVLAAEQGSRSVRRGFVSYDSLMADWRTAMTRAGDGIGIAWPNNVTHVAAEVDAFLRPDLRHHAAEDAMPESIPWQIQTWVAETEAALRDLARGATIGHPMPTLDRVRADVTAWGRAIGR